MGRGDAAASRIGPVAGNFLHTRCFSTPATGNSFATFFSTRPACCDCALLPQPPSSNALPPPISTSLRASRFLFFALPARTMSMESPAVSAVAANAGDSRPEAAESKLELASKEAPVDQGNEKPSADEEQAEGDYLKFQFPMALLTCCVFSEQKKSGDIAAAEPAEVNGKDTETTDAQVANGTPAAKSSAAKRKSTGGASSAKKLNKKKSQQRITHLDAQPGEYYLARLKSFPPWPSIICDEEMLPQSLLNTRPVTTKQADGTYKENYADGGKRAYDRTFPIMFLETNEL